MCAPRTLPPPPLASLQRSGDILVQEFPEPVVELRTVPAELSGLIHVQRKGFFMEFMEWRFAPVRHIDDGLCHGFIFNVSNNHIERDHPLTRQIYRTAEWYPARNSRCCWCGRVDNAHGPFYYQSKTFDRNRHSQHTGTNDEQGYIFFSSLL